MVQESVPSVASIQRLRPWELATGCSVCYAVPQMWGASRGTASLLALVMFASSVGPMTMACAAQPEAVRSMRKPVDGHPGHPVMQCHHAMAQSEPPQPESSEASFRAVDSCCPNHCCCGATTSEWAQPASNLLSFLSLLIEPARPLPGAVFQSSVIFGLDSARAPPLS
jgi:hypothetical protein